MILFCQPAAGDHPRRQYWFLPDYGDARHPRSLPHRCVAAWNIFRWVPLGPQLLKFVFAKFVNKIGKTMNNSQKD